MLADVSYYTITILTDIVLIHTFCTYTLHCLYKIQIPSPLLFTSQSLSFMPKYRFLSPSSSHLKVSFLCLTTFSLFNHTLSLVLLCLCLCLHFVHFNGCVCGVAPLVALAFLFVCVHHTLHPALHLVSLHCMYCLCIFASVFPCFCVSPHHC
jgi:hypothetical protein